MITIKNDVDILKQDITQLKSDIKEIKQEIKIIKQEIVDFKRLIEKLNNSYKHTQSESFRLHEKKVYGFTH